MAQSHSSGHDTGAEKQGTKPKKRNKNNNRSVTREEQKARAEKRALLRADTFTNAPRVSARTLTNEEREQIEKLHEEEAEEAEKLAKVPSRGPVGRWWHKIQSSPDRVTLAMSVVALGVVYGDIGTSPLYTAQTFLAGQGGLTNIDRPAVLGLLSLVFWSITLITTVKYVLVAMRIDNKGEGGIFALFSLIRHHGKWLVVPAMLGGAAFLADSVLTPAVSISSAVEGLKTIPLFEPAFHENGSISLVITVVIIVLLFCVQSRGTESIGKVFGSVVLVWFTFLAITGIVNIGGDWSIFEAANPVYGIEFLFSSHNMAGLAIMGTVFLSTTGAEALYSDMGHVGRGNIYFTWP
ncbi:K+ potassium transporter, partial [Bifidobacterium bohemicum]